MTVTDSWLYRVVERFRHMVDDPGGKYDDNYILREFVPPAVSAAMSYMAFTASNPVVIRFPLTLTNGQEYYQLPRAHQYLRVARFDDQGRVLEEYYPRNDFNPLGPGIAVEDFVLRIQPLPTLTRDDWTVLYIPHSDGRYHYASGGRLDSTRTVLTLAPTATLGDLDREEGAYVGCKLRLIPVSGGTIESRLITAYDPETRQVTVRRPFAAASDTLTDSSSSTDNQESLTYEIVPTWHTNAMANAIAAKSALYAAPGLGLSQSKQAAVAVIYRDAMKNLGDSLSFKQGRVGSAFQRDTIDNEDLYNAGGIW